MLLFREIGRCRRHFRRELDRVDVEIVDAHDLSGQASYLENTRSNYRVHFNEVHHKSLIGLESHISLEHWSSIAISEVFIGVECDLVHLIAAHVVAVVLASLAKLLRNIRELNGVIFTNQVKLEIAPLGTDGCSS